MRTVILHTCCGSSTEIFTSRNIHYLVRMLWWWNLLVLWSNIAWWLNFSLSSTSRSTTHPSLLSHQWYCAEWDSHHVSERMVIIYQSFSLLTNKFLLMHFRFLLINWILLHFVFVYSLLKKGPFNARLSSSNILPVPNLYVWYQITWYLVKN